jgi:hypothetical protein
VVRVDTTITTTVHVDTLIEAMEEEEAIMEEEEAKVTTPRTVRVECNKTSLQC